MNPSFAATGESNPYCEELAVAKAIRTAAIIVAGVALAATAVGAFAVAGTALAATAATVATVASVTAGTLSIAATLAVKKPGEAPLSGNQTEFIASLDQGIPMVIGRTATAGCAVHDVTFDTGGSTNNAYQSFMGVWSLGPIKGIEAFQANGTTVTFADTAAASDYSGWMWLDTQYGATPESSEVQALPTYPDPPGWSATSKLSGYAAFAWTIKFDTAGHVYPGGVVPQERAIILGVKVYDPRQDSTFPGGSGPCRAGDDTTYVWEGVDSARPAGKNPFLHGLTWALGRFQNGKRVMAIGMALSAIDTAAFAQAANVADANGWEVGGVVYSTDGKWDILKKILAAGSGEPLQLGGMLSCTVDTPRVSLATIGNADIIGKCSIPGTNSIRDRFNGVIPTYRSEDHDWQLVPAAKVQVAAYVTSDGRQRTKALRWDLVQDVVQVAQLATYAIVNSREIDGMVLPLKIKWIGYKPGDCITVGSSLVGMDSQPVVVRRRHLDPSTGAVTLTLRTETAAKHAFALGQTTTPPPTPALSTVDRTGLLMPGVDAAWPNVSDPEGTKPEDNATVGAPAGTYVAGVLAEVVAEVVTSASDIFDSIGPMGAIGRANEILEDSLAEQVLSGLLLDDRATRSATGALALARQEVTQRISDGDEAEAAARLILAVRVRDAEAAVVVEQTARSDGDSAEATARLAITARLNNAGGAGVTAEAALAANKQAIVDETSARTSDVNAARSEFGDSIAAAVSEVTTEAAATYATVSSVDAIEAGIDGPGGLTARVDDLETVTVAQDGKLEARFEKLASIGGAYAGIRAVVELVDGSLTSNLALVAQAVGIWIDQGDGTFARLAYFEDGFVRIAGKLEANSIETNMLKVNAAVTPIFLADASTVAGTGGPGSSGGSSGGSGGGGGGSGGGLPGGGIDP